MNLCSCKQVLTIALAVVLFNLHITPTNGIGILLTLIGGVSLDFFLFMLFSSFSVVSQFTLDADDHEIGMVRLRRVPREE